MSVSVGRSDAGTTEQVLHDLPGYRQRHVRTQPIEDEEIAWRSA